MNYILAFLAIELANAERQKRSLEFIPEEERDYAWRQLIDRLIMREKYLLRVRDELQGNMDVIEREVARMSTKQG